MCKRLDVMSLTQVVNGPPTQDFLDGSGKLIKEPCGLIGVIAAGPDQRRMLEDLGVNMRWAEYNCDTERWERCLMSDGVADLLEDLHAEGDFPYDFEAGPSLGEVAWLRAHAKGATGRPALPLHRYIFPAPAETLDAIAMTGHPISVGPRVRRKGS